MAGDTDYRIAVEAVTGRVEVHASGQTIADSRDVRVMHETYLPSHCYFPKQDLADGLLEESGFRTFCPFKGTAHHWHLRLGDRLVENGAWSYEQPLSEARGIGGRIAFYPTKIEGIIAENPLPEAVQARSVGGPLIDWLMRGAWLCRTPAELTQQFANNLRTIGMPLWRLNVNLWALHPELAGQRFVWSRDADAVTESGTPHGALQHPAYLNSPVRHVSDGLGGVRQRLDIDDPEFRFPILDELRSGGGTDYVAMPLPFSDGQVQTITLTTDHQEGFATAHLGQVFEAITALARFYEVLTLRRNTTVLFDTYLGERTGRQVLGGLTQRGDGEEIRAAILFCDLRHSTVLAQSLERQAYLDLLNDFFERVAGPVQELGGEVLKFIGDAVLAIFPMEGEGDVAIERSCRQARDAAQAILERIDEITVAAGQVPVECAVGLHFGDVMYGNVGAPNRLDFTVIGTAANIAVRLSEYCKQVPTALLMSGDFADRTPEGLRSLGTRNLRNVADEISIFTLADGKDVSKLS